MITDDKIRELIAIGGESRNLDYKGPFSWSSVSKDEKIKIAKDVLAFANARDGGVILIGVDDATGELLGLSDEQFSSFDQTKFNDFVQVYTDPRHTSNIYRRELDGKKIVVIEIPEFVDVPIVCRQEATSSADPHKTYLRKAALYKRTDKATSEAIDDADELRELLNRALLRRQDELMAAMTRIINPQRQPEPIAELASYDGEISETDEFISLKIHDALANLGHWTVTFRPTRYVRNRIPELRTVQSMVREARVTARGRDFPYIAEPNASNFGRGFQSWVDMSGYISRTAQAWRAYTSGMFRWKGALWEDTHSEYAGRNVISWVGMIFSFTDWFTFAQRYYERFLEVDDSIRFDFSLIGAKDRALISIPPAGPLFSRYASQETNVLTEGTIDMAELRSDPLGAARRQVRRVLEVFNWNGVTDQLIADWQGRIDGRF